ATELRAVKLDDGRPLVIAGEAMVLADVLDMVTREAPVVGLITLGVVLLVLLIFLGPSLLIPCSLSAGATLAITAGLMPRLGLQFNYLNIIMAPVLFGLAVDGAVHVLVQHRSTGSITEVISETGRAVAGALLTTMFGFGAFLLAHHPGLNSLGRVALLGLAVNIFVTLVALPSALVLYDRARKLAAQTSFKSFGTELLVTCGLAGHAPVGPGTLGALLALPIAAFASAWSLGPKAALVVVVVVLSTVWTAGYLRRTKSKDPSEVVIDELAGCLIALLMVPTGLGWTVAAFVLFRLFDIFKPFPVNYIDERAPGAWGVMFDDVLAGVMAGAALIGLNLVGQSQGWWA
ncbi:MAG: phosphatidylglycerophosphatase A, partial [Myxococcota bacterium]